MADLATLEQRLSEAEDALHKLRIGQSVVSVDVPGGQSVRYSEASKLEAYIADLNTQIAKKKGKGGRSPIQLWPS